MSALRIESDTLHLAGPSSARSVVHVGIAHPTPIEENAFGKLYTVVEIDSTERINQAIVSSLQEELRTAYYRSTEFSVEAAFESALHHANTRLHGFITEGATTWLDHFNAIVAVIKGDLVTFAHVGRIHAFLFRGNRIIDIVGRGTTEDKRNPLKIFASLFTGHVQPLDRFLLCTSSLLDFFSLEKLKRLITEDLPSTTMARVEHTLLAHPTPVPFAAILLAFLPQEEPLPQGGMLKTAGAQQPAAPQRSMDELIAKERATEQLLSPSLLPNVSGTLRTIIERGRSFVRTKILGLPPRRKLPPSVRSSSLYPRTPKAARAFRSLQRLAVHMLLAIFALPRLIRRIIGGGERVTTGVRELPGRATGNTRRFLRWARALTPLQKGLLLGAIIVLFILSQGIVSSRVSSSRKSQRASAEATAATLQENLDRAAAALTYEDYAGAKRLLDESSTLLEKLPKRTRSDKERRAELATKINDVRERTRRVKTPSFSSVASLSGTLGSAIPSSIALAGTTLVLGSEEPNRLLRVNPDDGSSKVIDVEAPGVRFLLSLDTRTVLIGTSENDLAELSLSTNTIRPLAVTFTNVDRTLVAGALFQSRLYLLDTKNNAILRAPRTGTGFDATSQWLRNTAVDLRNGAGIAVDGRIYVVTNNGALLRLSAGVRDEVTFEDIDPPLQAPKAVWTNEQSPLLYVLEPSLKRLLVFKKSSRTLDAQLVHESFGNARSFVVDERQNTLYLLTNDSLFRASLGE